MQRSTGIKFDSRLSTHPAMSRPFVTLLESYGRVGRSPSASKNGYGWLNYCYLDRSFEFLLDKPRRVPTEILKDSEMFLNFFAGYLDAEGNFRVFEDDNRVAYCIRINSEDEMILRDIKRGLRAMGFHVYLGLLATPSRRNRLTKQTWTLGLFRKEEVLKLLPNLPLRHDEKARWQKLTIESANDNWQIVKTRAAQLRLGIKAEVEEYCRLAETRFLATRRSAS